MRKILDVILIVGFLALDWLIFHDIFKAGEAYTVAEFLTGVLSVLVIIRSVMSLVGGNGSGKKAHEETRHEPLH